jgi:chaperonin GroES
LEATVDAITPAKLKHAIIAPLNDRIVVEQPSEDIDQMTEGGLVKPENSREKPQYGLVVAVGDGYQLDNIGMTRPLTVKPGDYVAFGRYAGVPLEAIHPNYIMMREDEVLGILRFEED